MTVVLLDAKNALFRYGYAHQRLSTREGVPTGALYGSIGCLMRLKRRYPDARFVMVWDVHRKDGWKKAAHVSWRTALLPAYKQRDTVPDEISGAVLKQQPGMARLGTALGIPQVGVAGVEADDLIAILATRLKARGEDVVIYSSDKDFMQLMTAGIRIIRDVNKEARMGAENPQSVLKTFGCCVENVLKIRAFCGDDSDKIPVAVRGIGPKSAVMLVEKLKVDPGADRIPVGSHKLVLKAADGWQSVRRNYRLMELVTDARDARLGAAQAKVAHAVRKCLRRLAAEPARDYRVLVELLQEHELEEALEARLVLYNVQMIR